MIPCAKQESGARVTVGGSVRLLLIRVCCRPCVAFSHVLLLFPTITKCLFVVWVGPFFSGRGEEGRGRMGSLGSLSNYTPMPHDISRL